MATSSSVESWLCLELAKLGIDASEDNANYILGIPTAAELEEYMLELLDGSDFRTQNFIQELLQRWRPPERLPENIKIYQKSDEENYFIGATKNKNKKSVSVTKNSKDISTALSNGDLTNGSCSVNSKNINSFPGESVSNVGRQKQKFVPLFSQEGQEKTVIHLHGRHVCDCQASKHSLISNCLKCGRVVCTQEGSGPCLFCGTLVCTKEEQEILLRGSRKSEALRQKLMASSYTESDDKGLLPYASNKIKDGISRAEQHKDKLLEYDRTSARRTQVIDDESDYFCVDSRWLSKNEKDLLKKRQDELRSERFQSKKDRKVTLDFAGRRVVEADSVSGGKMYDVKDDVIQQVFFGGKSITSHSHGIDENFDIPNALVNPSIISQAPQYVPADGPHSKKVSSQNSSNAEKRMRIQDKELQEMSDEGMCLSMHQPWASLLISGIKTHEGRTWYSAHRGRLWIAATAKSPDPQETAEVEQSYRYLLKDPNLQFPSSYPVGCLLGCVEVLDCLSQEDYKQKFHEAESGSPYVFICDNPQVLVVKFPVKGKHKIYKLQSHIHQAARKGLKKS